MNVQSKIVDNAISGDVIEHELNSLHEFMLLSSDYGSGDFEKVQIILFHGRKFYSKATDGALTK